ncbi:hypothetical protein GIW81_02190 [Hyphomicrobium sp. xq]|uniref:Uncharacterized protein n=1 Tax=Hyphomicrobium album TaxID=2665159 RepID=A0A6I3KGN3_9HYPH|nr:hypothetical protein [Hyphomicrobium album]MTD93140.1 hypothetical protein [Hyphomicrobium album]
MTLSRSIDIFVKDRNGRRLPGALISFSLDGAVAGSVPESDGRARIDLENDYTGPVGVTVDYSGEKQTQTLAPGVSSYTFTYDVDIAPKENHIALIVGIILVGAATVLAFSFPETTPLQTKLVQGLLSLGLGAIATEVSGLIRADLKLGTRLAVGASGAFAVFVILWFTNAML